MTTIEFLESKGWAYTHSRKDVSNFLSDIKNDSKYMLYYASPYLQIYHASNISEDLKIELLFSGRCLTEEIYNTIHETIKINL